MATWRAALRQGRGLWASRDKLGVAVDRRLSLNLGCRHYSPESESTVKKNALSFLGKPDVLNTLIRPAPCEEDSRGAVYAAEYALGVHNAEFHQGVCLTRVVRAHVLRLGWSIYSVSFEGRDRKGDVRLYHARVLHDLAQMTTRLFKFEEVDESFSKPSFSQTLKHSDPVDISQGGNDSCTWESKNVAIVPINFHDVEPQHTITGDFFSLEPMIYCKGGCHICFSSLISAGKADIWNGGVLYFLVMGAPLNKKYTSFLAVIKSRKLLVFRPVDELF